jgi:hypothetical protein
MAFDIGRTLEIARQIRPEDPGSSQSAQEKIARYVAAPTQLRNSLSFDDWGA